MTDMIEKKKVDIYSLYKKEKPIRIIDDEENYIDILLVKMTQGQRLETLNVYTDYLEEERKRLQEREEKYHTIALAVDHHANEDFIGGLVAFESAQRNEIVDLYPELEGKSEEERVEIIKRALDKFKDFRKEALNKETREELKKRFIDMTIESQALLSAVRILNYQSIVFMCLDVETRNQIFKTIKDVEKVADRRVLEKLIDEITEFRALESPKETRRIASSDSSFLQSGESQKS